MEIHGSKTLIDNAEARKLPLLLRDNTSESIEAATLLEKLKYPHVVIFSEEDQSRLPLLLIPGMAESFIGVRQINFAADARLGFH